ncbi:Pro-Pol polyprotein [Trachymyrmex cornetzi]|uniref:Pro-Pol polyprotein n=1 Tax=Trachymyrmex cornetzi TaxID=471704 RepID=A0A151JR54_9HYME|nr:Pro-Pol polyprotein [Trachymyrmex cornetzi]
MQLVKIPKDPLEILHIDHFGPLQQTKDGYRHILIIVDSFTRFTWLFPTKTTSTKEVTFNLKNLFDIFGPPQEIVSDRGTAFTSAEFEKFVNEQAIKHRLTVVASPWANGIVERVNRFLKSSLKKLTASPSEWKASINKAQYVINNSYHSSIKNSPSKLLLGYDRRKHSDKILTELIAQLANIDIDLVAERQTNRDIATETTRSIREYNKMYYDHKHKTPSQYNVGDYVMIRKMHVKPGQNSKLLTPFKGPYQINKVLNNNRYVVTDIPGFNVTQKPYSSVLSTDKLKPWIRPVQLIKYCYSV